MKTLYEQLGVTPMASQTAIQQSCFRLVKKSHPANTLQPGAERARAEHTALQNAYRTLSNCQSRAEYDRSLQQELSSPGAKRNAWQAVRHER
ncbi:MAG TPA: DnaJ domain-containing protein [Burkholderiales bacterium]|nr:DnaJ domain-containing protein [Burkholderiales bacterium]